MSEHHMRGLHAAMGEDNGPMGPDPNKIRGAVKEAKAMGYSSGQIRAVMKAGTWGKPFKHEPAAKGKPAAAVPANKSIRAQGALAKPSAITVAKQPGFVAAEKARGNKLSFAGPGGRNEGAITKSIPRVRYAGAGPLAAGGPTGAMGVGGRGGRFVTVNGHKHYLKK